MRFKPIIVAGPCSAESLQQIEDAARPLAAFRLPKEAGGEGIRFFRAGLWKPRTQPGAFEGVGAEGLSWLSRIQQKYAVDCCTEVASALHVEQALAAGLSAVWIGARTTTNPFMVQEIASALRGTRVHVFVKNPINPDLLLWIGALQRMEKEGVERLYAVHRGFSDAHTGHFRNAPLWMVPVDFKIRMPHIPLLCDPSHMTGDRKYIHDVAQRSLDLSFDGLMLEVHPSPATALCDAAQQLDFGQFARLMQTLHWRVEGCQEHTQEQSLLEALRARIDVIDEDLVDMLAQRYELVEQIGRIKNSTQMGIVQTDRWSEVLHNVRSYAREKGLDNKVVEEIYHLIHQQSIIRQTQLIGGEQVLPSEE